MKAVLLRTQNFMRSATNWFTLQLEGQKPKSNIASLDGVRALACLSVVLFHLSLITTRDVPLWKPAQFNIIISSLAFTGDTGVTLFFVLSGFLLFLPYAKALLFDGDWPSARFFYLRRALRILPAYYVTLILLILFYHPEYFSPDYWRRLPAFLLLFMDSFPQTYKQINGPLWSLAVEWQFYLILPILVLAMRPLVRRGHLRWRMTMLIFCLLALIAWGVFSRYMGTQLYLNPKQTFLLPRNIINLILPFVWGPSVPGLHGKFLEDFAVGMLISSLYTLARATPGFTALLQKYWPALVATGAASILVLAIWKYFQPTGGFPPYDYVAELFFSLAYAFCILGLLFGAHWFKRPFEWRPLRWLGIVSYGLYMWHLMLLVSFARLVVIPLSDWAPWLRYSLFWGFVALFIIPCMFLLFIVVERPFLQLGDRIIAASKKRGQQQPKQEKTTKELVGVKK